MPKLKPDQYAKIRTYVRAMMDLGDTAMSARSSAWQKVEERYRAFVNPAETHPQSGKTIYPWEETVVIPYSYALLQAKVAYWFTLYTAQLPLMRVQDPRGENLKGSDYMELVLEHYNMLQKANLILYGSLLDAAKYGMGGGKVLWETRTELRYRTIRRPVTLAGLDLGTTETRVKREMTTYDGPMTTLWDPWLITPDPRLPLWRQNDGNFIGESMFVSWYRLQERRDDPYVNLDDVPRWTYQDALAVARSSYRLKVLGLPNYFDYQSTQYDKGFVFLEQLWARLMPSDLDLGPNRKDERPELWLFTLANRDTIIQAEPVDDLTRFPYWFMESSSDMHSTMNPGDMEILMPLQDFMDWLFNSHIENVRKALNDMFVADPERITITDLLKPQPMKVIRLRPEFYGTDIGQAIKQLEVQDVTRTHLQDVSMIFDLMQRISAALDALMGVPSSRRRTATESAGTMQLAANRLKVHAQLMSGMGIGEWASLQMQLLQQHLTESQLVKIVGPRHSAELAQMAEGTIINVDPDELQGEWQFMIHDGSMPLDPVRTADVWREILTAVSKIPQLEQVYNYDLGKIFERGVRVLGVRNPEDLKRAPQMKPQVMPDEQVMRHVQAGNLVPAGGPGGPGGPGPNGGPRAPSPGIGGLAGP